ncbi:MAG TPA: hypothetical protein VJP45_10395 [Candidatus Limnocylindria bacterium]|nr:hypothetical protein [Candidatus Limnocylindria bacterium]
MARPKTKKTPAKRRGFKPKASSREPAEQLEVKGTERARVPVLERLDRELTAAKADQKAASETAKQKQKRIADELRKLPDEYGGKYRTDEGRLLSVELKDIVKSRPTKKPAKKRRNAQPEAQA